ncbi:MAG: glycosyltransferase [Lachnospiraceae bacterium]|nr:glycosyltransferase [Lachnospiraceae bacterium]
MDVKLSVVFVTYNHAKYVRKALDGIVGQKTDFAFEVICCDDASTDNTQDIIREYADRNPGMFRFIFREKNTRHPTLSMYDTSMAAKGEYLAYLEGDDYWTDMNKLQKQVDFLETHPEYMGTTHSFTLIGENDEPIVNEKISSLYDWSGDYTWEDWKKPGTKWPGQTASNVCRNFYHNKKMDYTILYRAHDFIDDGVIFTFILLQGKIKRFDEAMAAHRYVEKDGGESWNSLKLKRDYMLEEAELQLTMMRWTEENAGLSKEGFERASRQLKTAISLFVKQPAGKTFSLCRRAIGYYFFHLRFGKVKKYG